DAPDPRGSHSVPQGVSSRWRAALLMASPTAGVDEASPALSMFLSATHNSPTASAMKIAAPTHRATHRRIFDRQVMVHHLVLAGFPCWPRRRRCLGRALGHPRGMTTRRR